MFHVKSGIMFVDPCDHQTSDTGKKCVHCKRVFECHVEHWRRYGNCFNDGTIAVEHGTQVEQRPLVFQCTSQTKESLDFLHLFMNLRAERQHGIDCCFHKVVEFAGFERSSPFVGVSTIPHQHLVFDTQFYACRFHDCFVL